MHCAGSDEHDQKEPQDRKERRAKHFLALGVHIKTLFLPDESTAASYSKQLMR
jgi:hypothetical protein